SIHDRMPVILHPQDYDRWLDRSETQRLPIDLLRPFEAEAMTKRAANPKVGNAANNGPEMLDAELEALDEGGEAENSK
ncbi:MAG: SOS response-associated peptidase family protein, partial [Bryocella sp.]